ANQPRITPRSSSTSCNPAIVHRVAFVWFLLLVGVLVAVHEAGHLLLARLLGVQVLKISLGFGRPIFSVWRQGTEYAIGRWPLGGYVRLLGEQHEDVHDDMPDELRARAFSLRPAWQRLAIILAGPAANLVFPLLLLSHVYARSTSQPSSTIGSVF